MCRRVTAALRKARRTEAPADPLSAGAFFFSTAASSNWQDGRPWTCRSRFESLRRSQFYRGVSSNRQDAGLWTRKSGFGSLHPSQGVPTDGGNVPMTVSIRKADDADVPFLARMNEQLVADQGSRNPFTAKQYEHRFAEWLVTDWEVDVFEHDVQRVGYSVYRVQADEYYSDQQVVYVRQFYIERQHRRRGLGTTAFSVLQEARFPEIESIALDVLATNPSGQRFWEHIGFEPYFVNMKRRRTLLTVCGCPIRRLLTNTWAGNACHCTACTAPLDQGVCSHRLAV